MLNLRVRTVTDNGSVTAASRILDTTNILYTATLNASATLEFSVSRKDFAPTQFPFLVRVEYRAGTDEFDVLPTEDLFIIESDGDDSKDATQIVTYEGKSFVPWLLGGAYVGTGSWEKDNERRIDNGAANAGRIMSFFIDESKGRGWLTPLTRTFNGTTDSNGVAWTTNDRVDIAWRLETFYPQVLEQLSDQALCDWDSKGNAIRLYRHNTLGTDVSESVVFGGPDFVRVPVTTDVTGWYTHVIAVSDAGRVHVQNEAAETRFGRRSMALSQTGVKDKPTSTKLANEALDEGLKVKREESYEWTPHSGQVMPWKDFVVGDLVTALSRGGSLPKRVIGIAVTQAEDSATVNAVVGDKITTLQARAQKRLKSVSVGGVIGGSGGAYPTAPPPNDFDPAKPVALSVTSNVGYWAEDWTTARSEVGLGWDAVTADTEGNPITITGYEVWSRLPSDTLALDTATHTNAVTVNSWEPGVERRVAVRAVGLNGKYSEFSTEISITPDAPLSVVPEQVTGLTELSNVASFTPSGPVAVITLGWDAVTETTDGDPIEVARYDVLSGAAVITSSATTSATVSMPSTATASYTVRAVSALGHAGDPSDPVLVTANTPGVVTRAPTAPTLTTGYANAFAHWDGTYVSGGTVGAMAVWTEASLSSSGPWQRQGVAMTDAGTTMLSIGSVDDEVFVRFVAVDQLSRPTGTSDVESIVIDGIDGEAILVDSIEGNRLKFGTIETDHLAANVGETLNITSNESVQIMVTQQEQLSSDVSAAQAAAENAQGLATDASIAAGEAIGAAQTANNNAANAQDTAAQAAANIAAQQAVFVVTATGADVRSVDATSIVRIVPSGISIVQNGTDVSSWDGSQFNVGQIVVRDVGLTQGRIELMGNHAIERSGTRTVFKKL